EPEGQQAEHRETADLSAGVGEAATAAAAGSHTSLRSRLGGRGRGRRLAGRWRRYRGAGHLHRLRVRFPVDRDPHGVGAIGSLLLVDDPSGEHTVLERNVLAEIQLWHGEREGSRLEVRVEEPDRHQTLAIL